MIVIDYFQGKWPEWFPLFLETCRWNPTVNWLFHTDCPVVETHIDNVAFQHMTYEAYVDHVNRKLNVRFHPKSNYKLCDLRPMYGVLWEEDIRGFDFFGYGDLDVVYGNIRDFYTSEVLENDVISTHEWCLSGHLCLLRNCEPVKLAFERIPGWKSMLELDVHARLDEDYFIDAFVGSNWRVSRVRKLLWRLNGRTKVVGKHRESLYLKEQYTTPLTPTKWIAGICDHPQAWYWRDGKLTNDRDGERQFIYLHFMNYVSGRWLSSRYGSEAIWNKLDRRVHIDPSDAAKGFQVDHQGFRAIQGS